MKTNVRKMVKMAMYVVLFVVLDYISAYYIPRMPQGGSWGIGTTVLIIAAYDLGVLKSMGITLLVL
ncbi:MAG: thiamine transporter, partial [Erysipelothrix sp.]|nr:thiamine transporter [Erysipelothrix sp.]